jgi:hypothetical protein
MLGERLDRTQHVMTTDLPDQATMLDHRQPATPPNEKALGQFDDIGIRANRLDIGGHLGADTATSRLVIGAGENTAQAITLRQHADQMPLGIDHWSARNAVLQQTIDGSEKASVRPEGHQMARHVIAHLDGFEYGAASSTLNGLGHG